jgi:UDP-N-acetylglucosamine--N-acetylmuramyl-(pentapeptide) pyrophosphoryl-undecaprenol N-acetylglucosamine transferase
LQFIHRVQIPSPNVAEDHQTKNARAMEAAGAAVLMEERRLSATSLSAAIDRLLGDRQRLESMRMGALAVAKPNAAAEIALAVIRIAAQRKEPAYSIRDAQEFGKSV